MTLTLGKIEMANTKLRFRRSNLPRAQKEKIIRYQLQRFEEVYMKYFDWQCDAHRLYRLGTRLMMSRLWMMMYDAALCGSEKERIEESLILCNADVLEVARQLPHKYQKHGWFFRCGYTQWHAVSYLLIQLCKRQYANESAVERAWQVIEAAFADWRESGVMEAKNDHPNIGNATIKRLWRPLVRLLEQARMSRNSELGLGSPSANAPSTLNTEITPESDQFVPFQDTLIGDPFFGSTGLSMEMSWDDLNDWVQDFQEGLYDQSVELQSMECQDQGL
jgi:hypothetical protein